MSPGERCDAIMKMIDEGLQEDSDANGDLDDGIPGSQPEAATLASDPIDGANPLNSAA